MKNASVRLKFDFEARIEITILQMVTSAQANCTGY